MDDSLQQFALNVPISLDDNSNNQASRKRARIACELCHERKVRCDVSLVGWPCSNCRLDAHVCSVRSSSARRPKKRLKALRVESAPDPPVAADSQVLPLEANRLGTSSGWPEIATSFLTSPFGSSSIEELPDLSMENYLSSFPSRPTAIPPSIDGSFLPFPQDLTFNTSVTFSYYRFLRMKELSRLAPDDVRYLEVKGCLHVPSRPYLDHFVRCYFLNVHPCMPMLDEGRFWDMYSTARNDVNETPVISLLVLQAMLFAASTFVPLAILKACGFQNYYIAREILHQRAKLLYNFRTETDFAAIAQASLLLSFQSTPDDTQANTSWLSTAIQYARADSAHLYYCLRGLTSCQRRGKKRLWWCCVLRDRVVALGVRRHLQITPDHFDLHQEAVTERDFAEEVQLSQVYDSETKKLLVKIFMAQCQLAIAVTSTVMAIYPLSGVTIPAVSVTSQQLTIQNQIEKSKIELLTWLETAKPQLTPDHEKFAAPHNSVILYVDLTYIYYFSARLALCHYSMYMLGGCHAFATHCTQQLKAIQGELEDSIHNMTSKVTNLVTLGLTGHLPISVMGYIALPLVLLSLDVRFSSTESQKSRCRHQLSVYMEAMKHYGHRFTFVGVVSDTIRKLLQLVDLNERPTCPTTKTNSLDTNLHGPIPPSVRPKSWVEFVTGQPQLYSKLSISLDFALSKGKYPSEKELPGWALNPTLLPQATIMPIEPARPASHISMLNPRGSLMGHSRYLGDELYNQQQKYQLSEATWLSPIASDVFGLENSMEMGLLCDVDHIDTTNHHDDNDTNESAYNRLAGIFDISLMGGCTNGCA